MLFRSFVSLRERVSLPLHLSAYGSAYVCMYVCVCVCMCMCMCTVAVDGLDRVFVCAFTSVYV